MFSTLMTLASVTQRSAENDISPACLGEIRVEAGQLIIASVAIKPAFFLGTTVSLSSDSPTLAHGMFLLRKTPVTPYLPSMLDGRAAGNFVAERSSIIRQGSR